MPAPEGCREQQSLEVWADGAALNDKAVADGLDHWDALLFEASGAPPACALRRYGSREPVEDFVHSEDFEAVIRAQLTVTALGF
jgi:hypothetical protein